MLDLFAEFHFLRPWWLLAIPFTLLGVYWLDKQQHQQQNAWASVMDPRLLAALSTEPASPANTRSKLRWVNLRWIVAAITTLGLIALAGPTAEQRELPLSKSQLARVVVLDLSRSMLAADVEPNRLEQAKRKARDLFQQLNEGETGMVVFAGEAFAISPLTNDSNTLAAQLPALSPNVVPIQGGRVINALQEASKLLRNAGHNNGDIIFLSDSTPSENAYDFAEKLAAKGYRSHVIAFGSEQGAPIPAEGGGFIKDSNGNIVLPKLNNQALRQFALAGAGHFSAAQLTDADIRPFLDQKPDIDPAQQAALEAVQNSWIDAGVWLMPVIALLASLLFRRGWLAPALLACCITAPSETSWADEGLPATATQSLWQNQAQYGHQLYQKGQYKEALDIIKDPQWRASAAYQDGQYHQAAELYAQDQSADGHYNRGNALAKAGELESAIEAYTQALAQNPDHGAAQKNKKTVEAYLQQQKQQQDSDKQPSSESQDADSQPSEGQQPQPNKQNQSQASNDSSDESQDSQAERAGQPQNNAANDEKNDESDSNSDDEQQPQPADAQKNDGKNSLSAAELAQQQAEKQARQQWLQRIPDDPAALWRNKFAHEYDQRERRGETTQNYSDEAW